MSLRNAADSGTYADQVSMLLQLADEGVRLQPQADAAIRVCGSPGGASNEVAEALGEALRHYSRLYHRVDGLEPDTDPDLAQTVRDLRGQLSYHLHMLRDAGDLVFSGRVVARNERFRRELAATGLGPHARGLTLLRNALLARRSLLP